MTHLYSSDTGIHDTRLFANHEGIPYWAHLRPEQAHLVTANCYVNELRLDEYRRIFSQAWPGLDEELFQAGDVERDELAKLREAGELTGFSDEELLTNALCTLWRKPEVG